MVLTSVLIFLLSIVLSCCGTGIVRMATGAGARGMAPAGGPGATGAGAGAMLALGILFLLAMLVSVILLIAGCGFCMLAPPKHGARVLAITAFGLTIGSLLLLFAGLGINVLGGALGAGMGSPMALGAGRSLGGILEMLMYPMLLAALIVFLFFLRSVAISLRNQGLAQSVLHLLILGGVMFAGVIGMIGLMFFVVAAGPGAAGDALAGVGLLSVLCVHGADPHHRVVGLVHRHLDADA
jgi:hypothetical protein